MKTPAWMARLGWPGVAGLGLLAYGVVLYVAAIAPARAERDALEAERERLAAAQTARQRPAVPVVQKLPSFAQAPELLKQLNELAQRDGISVTRSSYQIRDEDARRIFEVQLPLKVAYPTLRGYLRDALALSPTARLDNLELHRAQASDPLVDADVRLSFTFAAAS